MSQNTTKFLDVVILNCRHVSAPAVHHLQVTEYLFEETMQYKS